MAQRREANKAMEYAKVKQIEEWISLGYSTKTIREMIHKVWGHARYEVQNRLIKEASREITKDIDKEVITANLTGKLDAIQEKCIADGDYKTAITAISAHAKIAGLEHGNTDIEVNDGDKVIKVSFG